MSKLLNENKLINKLMLWHMTVVLISDCYRGTDVNLTNIISCIRIKAEKVNQINYMHLLICISTPVYNALFNSQVLLYQCYNSYVCKSNSYTQPTW